MAPLNVLQPNVDLYFAALLVSGVSCMGRVRPKVREEPAGSTATWRLTRKCVVMTPTPMPVPTTAPYWTTQNRSGSGTCAAGDSVLGGKGFGIVAGLDGAFAR